MKTMFGEFWALSQKVRAVLLVLTIASSAFVSTSFAQTLSLPEGFIVVDVGGSNPKMPYLTGFAFAPDGRIFVTMQEGYVRVIKDDVLLEDPFYTVNADSWQERGLVGIVFDPDFTTNGYVYLNYTTAEQPLHNKVIRVTADGDHAVEGSEVTILELDNVPTPSHIGGAMGFGADGKLYISAGDNVNPQNAQDLNTYHGKVLRVNKEDGSAPEDNPFFATGSEKGKRIWAMGFRNPFSMGVHPITGQIFVNDVGLGSIEEINNITTGGHNFGWPSTEGPTGEPQFSNPVFSYPHSPWPHSEPIPSGCAITGGDFLHAGTTNYPAEYVDKYFFFDLCARWLCYIDPSAPNPQPVVFATDDLVREKINLGTGPDGNLYFLSHVTKQLHKIVYSTSGSPIITSQPITQSKNFGKSVVFAFNVSGQESMEYQWYKDEVEIEGATENTYSISELDYDDAGAYSVVVTNDEGTASSTKANLTVGPPNEPPVATILLPTGTETYIGGGTIEYSGEATDPEDGTLPTEAFEWHINFHHDTHYHDQPPVVGATGVFNVPNRGEPSSNVWYRLILKVTDAAGDFDLDSVDVHPIVSKVTITSNPPGALMTLDGQPGFAPFFFNAVTGMVRDLHAIEPQSIGGTEYEFGNWTQGGEALQSITVSDVDTEYTATFAPILGLREYKEFDVYPTLADNEVFVPWTSADELPEIRFSDMLGRVHYVPVARTSDEFLVADLRALPPSIYILSCIGKDRKFTAKIAIAR